MATSPQQSEAPMQLAVRSGLGRRGEQRPLLHEVAVGVHRSHGEEAVQGVGRVAVELASLGGGVAVAHQQQIESIRGACARPDRHRGARRSLERELGQGQASVGGEDTEIEIGLPASCAGRRGLGPHHQTKVRARGRRDPDHEGRRLNRHEGRARVGFTVQAEFGPLEGDGSDNVPVGHAARVVGNDDGHGATIRRRSDEQARLLLGRDRRPGSGESDEAVALRPGRAVFAQLEDDIVMDVGRRALRPSRWT